MRPVNWIQTELARHYENLDLSQGVDLDRNGKIEGSEKTDQNNDGNVDSAEWQKFMGDNKAALKKLGGFFKTYYSAGTKFKPDNPIHDLISIESELVSPDEVKIAYKKAEEILQFVKKELADLDFSPEFKLRTVYYSMKENGIQFENVNNASFVNNINKGTLDCDTSSFAVLAIAYELNWPVYLVQVPDHAFVRWDDGEGKRCNMDLGNKYSDEFYLSAFNISQHALDLGVYMRNMEYDDVLIMFYYNLGNAKDDIGKYEDAISSYDKVIEIDPNHATAYSNRGGAKADLGNYEEAIKDFDKAIEIDPNFATAYFNRGIAESKLGKLEQAIEDYNKAIEIDPNYIQAYYSRANANFRLGRFEETINDYDKAIELDPDDIRFYNNRGGAELSLGRYEEAIKDFDKVLELDPNNVVTYNNRNLAEAKLREYNEMNKETDKTKNPDPNDPETHNNRDPEKKEVERSGELNKEADKKLKINPPPSCLCNTIGQSGNNTSSSNPSLLSLILTVMFD